VHGLNAVQKRSLAMNKPSMETGAFGAESDSHAAARAARQSVLLVALTDRSGLVVSGKDRVSWLNGLLTCDLATRGENDAAYGLWVEKKGRIVSDVWLVPRRHEAGMALAVPTSEREALATMLDHYLIMEQVEIQPADVAFFLAIGPQAPQLLAAGDAAGRVDMGLGQDCAVIAFDNVQDASSTGRVQAWVERARAEHHAEVVSCTSSQWAAVAVEFGLPRWGIEFDRTMYPQEASLERIAVSFSKGCYLGQEVVYMLEHRGHVQRKLVSLELEVDAKANALPERGTPVTLSSGETVGTVASATVGPWSTKPVAIAMVKWAWTKPESELFVGGQRARMRAPSP